ncbi:MAG: dynamin family protein [Vicinamibacterales bacterium]
MTPEHQRQVAEAREVLARLSDELLHIGATSADTRALEASIRQLDDFFLLVVVGEFNAGKSALINALLSERLVDEGVTPTTAQVAVLTYGDTVTRMGDGRGAQIVTAPVELLRTLHVVDTPGTNAILREHERLTTDFVPRSDVVLFLTSADRPYTETERQFMALLRDWGKKILIVVNKMDIVPDAEDRSRVLEFVRGAAERELGLWPQVLGVSARLAMRARHGDPSLWSASGFDELERTIRDLLEPENRFRIKLANPLGVGAALVSRYATIAAERLALLQGDVESLEAIDREIGAFSEQMRRGFDARMDSIQRVLADMEARGQAYFDETLRIGRVIDLLNRARMQREFTETVIADVPVQIERKVAELIDWLVDQEFREWQAVTSALLRRRRDNDSGPLGSPDVGTFHSDRARLMESVGREAQRVVDTYDRQREAGLMADQARVAVAAAAAAGGAAVGLGAIVTVAASTLAADITGMLLASALLGIGFLVIPQRRRAAKSLLTVRIAELRERLAAALRQQFEQAQERTVQRLTDAVSPYARFVRSEEERWRSALDRLETLSLRLHPPASTSVPPSA